MSSPRHIARGDRRAFTLLEVVLAVALTVVLVGLMLGFHRYVLRVRDALDGQVAAIAAERAVMDRLTGEFRAAIAHPFLRGMEGEATWVSFATTRIPAEPAWARESMFEGPIPPEYDIERLSYQVRGYENEDGEWVVEGLERASEKTDLGRSEAEAEEAVDEDEEPPPGLLIAPDVKMVYLRYHDGSQWLDHWPPTKEDLEAEGTEEEEDLAARERRTAIDLPLAIEVNLGQTPKPEDMTIEDYAAEYGASRRVVYVPGGARAFRSLVRLPGASR